MSWTSEANGRFVPIHQSSRLPGNPIRTSRDATLFLRQAITCYVNCLKDDQDLMEKYKLLCLHTLTELKDMNAATSFEYVPLESLTVADIQSKVSCYSNVCRRGSEIHGRWYHSRFVID
jgi:hypothetical protein